MAETDSTHDILDIGYINSLPQPLIAKTRGGGLWPVYDICVRTALVRIDVCGLLEAKEIADFISFIDDRGNEHDKNGFYIDAIEEERAILAKESAQ